MNRQQNQQRQEAHRLGATLLTLTAIRLRVTFLTLTTVGPSNTRNLTSNNSRSQQYQKKTLSKSLSVSFDSFKFPKTFEIHILITISSLGETQIFYKQMSITCGSCRVWMKLAPLVYKNIFEGQQFIFRFSLCIFLMSHLSKKSLIFD